MRYWLLSHFRGLKPFGTPFDTKVYIKNSNETKYKMKYKLFAKVLLYEPILANWYSRRFTYWLAYSLRNGDISNGNSSLQPPGIGSIDKFIINRIISKEK